LTSNAASQAPCLAATPGASSPPRCEPPGPWVGFSPAHGATQEACLSGSPPTVYVSGDIRASEQPDAADERPRGGGTSARPARAPRPSLRSGCGARS
jgi:hypothetical protein